MSLKAVVKYIDYRLKRDTEQSLFECWLSENIVTIASGYKLKERVSYTETRNEIWQKKTQDTRTAKEIIADTLKKHGIKIKGSKANEPV